MTTSTSETATAAPRLRVRVDQGVCVASRFCISRLPGVFRLEDSYATVVDETPPAELRDALALAARECPSGAISLVEDEAL